MHYNRIRICYLTAIFLFAAQVNRAQTMQAFHKPSRIDTKTKTAVINNVSALIIERYVIPDVALQVKEYLTTRLKNGAYDTLDDQHNSPMLSGQTSRRVVMTITSLLSITRSAPD